MPVDFSVLTVGHCYSRIELAKLWGYASFNALARGVVTPVGDNKIILFITNEKQDSAEQYRSSLEGSNLEWEGPTDHFAEQRMARANGTHDEIHVLYRERHRREFTYMGQARVVKTTLNVGRPSSFTFEVGRSVEEGADARL